MDRGRKVTCLLTSGAQHETLPRWDYRLSDKHHVLWSVLMATVVLAKTLESPLNSKEIKPVNLNRNQL